MKIRITFKTPDVVDAAVAAAEDELDSASEIAAEMHMCRLNALVTKFFGNCREYCTVELDTEAETCTVVPNDRV